MSDQFYLLSLLQQALADLPFEVNAISTVTDDDGSVHIQLTLESSVRAIPTSEQKQLARTRVMESIKTTGIVLEPEEDTQAAPGQPILVEKPVAPTYTIKRRNGKGDKVMESLVDSTEETEKEQQVNITLFDVEAVKEMNLLDGDA